MMEENITTRSSGKGTVLIVDNDKDFVSILSDLLESRDYHIDTAFSEKTACEKIKIFNAQVALIDIRLDQGNGIDLITKLKARHPEIICVMMTAYADTDTAINALHKGAYDYLRKPFHSNDLLATLDRCFEKIRLKTEKREAEHALIKRNLELETINTRLRQIVEFSKKFATSSSLYQIAPMLLEEFSSNISAGGGSLFLKENDVLILVHSLDPGHVPCTIAFPLRNDSAFDQAIKKGEPVLIQDINKENTIKPSGWHGYKDGSLLVIPLHDEFENIIGIISLHDKLSPPFTIQDREIGSILASYSSEALRAANAVESLKKSEERYRLIAENASDIIWITDLNLEYKYVSPSVERMKGYKPEEIIGLNAEKFFTYESYKLLQKAVSEELALETLQRMDLKRSRMLELQAYKKNGSKIWIEVQMAFLRKDERPIGILGASRDINSRKDLEGQLFQAQKMEAIGTLAGGISHDFNNILQAISGFTQILLMHKQPEDPDYDKLRKIERSVHRASELTNQLLIFSSKVESKLRPVDLNYEIIQTTKILERTIPKMIKMELSLSKNLEIINADPVQLEQVIMNIALNARDSMPDGGKLCFETSNAIMDEISCITHPEISPGKYVLLSISDTGHGINKEIIEHIYEPFYTTKESGKGTGLGLAMVYGIVKNHKGSIVCTSEQGKGSTFRIYLPVYKIDFGDLVPEKIQEEKIIGGNETILLVDDEEIILEVGKNILGNFGYHVLTAESGEKAVDLYIAKKESVVLVVLDINMPGMGGYKCLEKLLEITPDLKILIASGYSESENITSSIETRASEFIKKPFTVTEMLKKVRKILDGKK